MRDRTRYRYTPSPVPAQGAELLEWLQREFRAIANGMAPSPGWEDLRSPMSSVNPAGSTAPPTPAEDGGMLFTNTGVRQTPILQQLSHRWVVNTPLAPHIHWCKTTDAAGTPRWELRWRIIANGVVAPAWSAWTKPAGHSHTIDATQKTLITYWPLIDMSGYQVSTILSYELRRNTASAAPDTDGYGASAKIWEFDTHIQMVGEGSINEYGD